MEHETVDQNMLDRCASFAIGVLMVGVLLGWPASAYSESADLVPVTVSVFTFNCGPKYDRVLTYFLNGKKFTPDLIARAGERITQISLKEPAGRYDMYSQLPQESQEFACESSVSFTVLPGRSRHVAMILGVLYTRHGACSLSGTLPAVGMTAELVLPKGHQSVERGSDRELPATDETSYPTEIDGDAYYVENILPGDYVLRIQSGGLTGDVPIDIQNRGVSPSGFCRATFTHNITLSELKLAFPTQVLTE